MLELWEREVENPYMRGALNMAQLTLACALGLEARNPDFDWRSGHGRLRDWYGVFAARPAFAATAPPAAKAS
jgi:glutathione S-transferase